MKRVLSIAGIILVVALLAWPKVKGYFSNENKSSAPAARSASVLQVEAFIVKGDTVENNIFTTGTLLANEDVELSSESSGIVRDIYLTEGAEVKKGDLLIKINDSDLQAQLNRAKFRLNLAEDREGRQKQLLEKGGISQEEYDATLNEVNVLRAEVALIEAQIDKTEIRAPFSGRLGLKYVSDGSYISPNSRITTLQDIDPIKIDFSVPERYAAQVEVGTKVSFHVQGIEETMIAEVYAKEPSINTETRTLQVRARSENTDGKLLPGAFADLELTLSTIDDALMVPTISLVPELEGQKVFVVKNGKVEPHSVQTGLRNDTRIQILDGVQPGDTVLTTGLLQVRPGMPVKVVNL
ncbi:MAG TPA: efflux transporter periplasmic adaptor subunit [Balneolaceae bacterium]|nr:efflux transporter periplasmic adaptor subunit [Balneolaceae bacterium]|tara:strand:+ start:97166 stop:98224 length:1059 start_codon:yes stop_codon:yes gene_type:complete